MKFYAKPKHKNNMETLEVKRLPLWRKIRFVRTLKGYSQEYMAMRMGISQNAYSKLERGRIRIRPDRLKIIGSILEVAPYNISRIRVIEYKGINLYELSKY